MKNKIVTNLKLIEFVALIFNPNKYPFKKQQLENIINGYFKDEEVQNVLNSFVWSSEKYFIDPKSKYLSPEYLAKAIYRTMLNWSCKDYIWALSINYNNQEDRRKFNELILKNNTTQRSTKIIECFQDAFKQVPEEKYTKENLNFSRLYKDNILSSYRHLDNFFEPFIINPCLSNIILFFTSFSKVKWDNFVDVLQNPLFCHYYNYFYVHKGKDIQEEFFLKILNKKTSDNVIALAFLNTIHSVNKLSKIDKNKALNISRKLTKSLDKLPQQRKIYWLGILLSNYEYSLNKDFTDDFEQILHKQLGKNLLECNKLPKELINGLKSSPRDCNIRHLKVYKNLYKQNEKLAFILSQEILKDYQSQLLEKENFHQPFNEKYSVSYTNTVIEAIAFLAYNKKIKIYAYFDKLFESLFLDKEAFKYDFSNYLKTKRAIIHLFCVAFIVFQNLENNRIALNKQKIEKYYISFIEYINRDLRHNDEDLESCFENIFNLEIFKKQSLAEKEINCIYNLPLPNFKLLSILLKFIQPNKFTNEVKTFICEYFDRYYKLWDNYKIKNWISIWINLKNREKAMICLNMLSEWEQNEYKEILEKHNMI